MKSTRLILLAAALAFPQSPVRAQQLSFGASGAYTSLNGDDYAGLNAGFGFDAQVRYHPSRSFSVGGGFQYTSHEVEGANESFRASGGFVDARYSFVLPSAPKVRPYLGGRFAIAHWSVPNLDASANGFAFGPVGGLLIQAGSMTRLDVGLAFLALNFGDAQVGGTEQPDTNTSGSALALRLGFVFGP